MANEEAKLQTLAKDTLSLMTQLADGMEQFNVTLAEAVELITNVNKATKQAAKPKA